MEKKIEKKPSAESMAVARKLMLIGLAANMQKNDKKCCSKKEEKLQEVFPEKVSEKEAKLFS